MAITTDIESVSLYSLETEAIYDSKYELFLDDFPDCKGKPVSQKKLASMIGYDELEHIKHDMNVISCYCRSIYEVHWCVGELHVTAKYCY